jgi:hypothetical protein
MYMDAMQQPHLDATMKILTLCDGTMFFVILF